MSGVVRSAVTGVGGYLPEQILTNAELAKTVDTSASFNREATASAP